MSKPPQPKPSFPNQLRFRGLAVGLTLAAALLFCGSARAQSPVSYGHFFQNPYFYNVGLAGYRGHGTLFTSYRLQWLGIEGAPSTAIASWNSPLTRQIAMGANFMNDNIGITNTSSGVVSFGYAVQFDKQEKYLRFGLGVGGGFTSINFSELTDPEDIALATQFAENNSFLIGQFGVAYTAEKFYLGLSLPSLLGRDIFAEESFSEISFTPLNRVILNTGYTLKQRRSKAGLSFAAQYQYNVDEGAGEAQGMVSLLLDNIGYVGLGYHQYQGPLATVGLVTEKGFGFGYVFNYPLSQEGFGTTHEVSVRLKLGWELEKATNKSWIARRQEQLRQMEERRREQREAQLRQQQQSQPPQQETEEQQEAYVPPAPTPKEQPQPTERPVAPPIDDTPPPVVQQPVVQPPVQEPDDEPLEIAPPMPQPEPEPEEEEPLEVAPPIPQPEPEPEEEEPLEVAPPIEQPPVVQPPAPEPEPEPEPQRKAVEYVPLTEDQVGNVPETGPATGELIEVDQGYHAEEAPKGHLLVVGEFDTSVEAELEADRLFAEGYFCNYGYVSERKTYALYIHYSRREKEAREWLRHWTQQNLTGSIWILKVK